ncbi:MAG: hypothetical protein R2705_12765 [Ilumatobacteraceae bacterium]
MARLLHDTQLDRVATPVPMPGAWDAIAQAAYEQGRADGHANGRAVGDAEGYERGRTELLTIAEGISETARACHDEIRHAHLDLVARIRELAEIYVETVVRHVPDATAESLLCRIDEALAALEPGPLELRVPEANVVDLRSIFAARDDGKLVTVVADRTLGAGEFRLRGDWADADGTWDHYRRVAHETIDAFLAEQAT